MSFFIGIIHQLVAVRLSYDPESDSHNPYDDGEAASFISCDDSQSVSFIHVALLWLALGLVMERRSCCVPMPRRPLEIFWGAGSMGKALGLQSHFAVAVQDNSKRKARLRL